MVSNYIGKLSRAARRLHYVVHFRLGAVLCLAAPLLATTPVMCPAGSPLGTFEVTAKPPQSGPPLTIETVNRLEPNDLISWQPVKLNTPEAKKARVALILVPSDHGKVKVFDPQPADKAVNWSVPARTDLVAIAYGPQGLDKGKVDKLLAKDDELIGELADYAKKTEQTQSLVQALTQQQQSLDTGQNVNAAVVTFANQYSGTKIDRTLPPDQQMLTLMRSVNPAIAAYDPLSQNPAQRASQSAGLAAAVAGLFFGTNVGLAATGGALLVNMHGMFFPNTEFRSSFAQTVPDHKLQTALCGNKTPSASRTELAFLWATRVPDAEAPEITLKKTTHLPIGAKTPVEVTVKARDPNLLARVRDWKFLSDDGKTSAPVAVKVDAETKTIEVDPSDAKLKPGKWKIAGSWDWEPLTVSGEVELRPFSTFQSAHLTPASHDRLTAGTGKCLADLEGADFEFVQKVMYKNVEDQFAQPVTLPFRVSDETTLETQLDPKSMGAGRYAFLLVQGDGKQHDVPFQVLPAPPQITNLPLVVNTGASGEQVRLEGTGLDRIETITADHAQITLAPEAKAITVTLDSNVKPGEKIALQMHVRGFAEPVVVPDALLVAGPRPEITAVHPAQAPDLGVALRKGEIAAGSFVGFALDIANAPAVDGVRLSCNGSPGKMVKARQEAAGSLFLSFNPASVGEPGCAINAEILTSDAGTSEPKPLGTIVRIPHIESFSITDQKTADNVYTGTLKGQDLDAIERVGWDTTTGTPVTAIPAPVAGGGSETLEIPVPWPAPAPHAPLYIWLRGETTGRATSAKL